MLGLSDKILDLLLLNLQNLTHSLSSDSLFLLAQPKNIISNNSYSLISGSSKLNEFKNDFTVNTNSGLLALISKYSKTVYIKNLEKSNKGIFYYNKGIMPKSLIISSFETGENKFILIADSLKEDFFDNHSIQNFELNIELIKFSISQFNSNIPTASWNEFEEISNDYISKLNPNNLSLFSFGIDNLVAYQENNGVPDIEDKQNLIFRLIKQTLPPTTPTYYSKNGETFLIIDKLLTKMYEKKIKQIIRKTFNNQNYLNLNFNSIELNKQNCNNLKFLPTVKNKEIQENILVNQ